MATRDFRVRRDWTFRRMMLWRGIVLIVRGDVLIGIEFITRALSR